MKTIFKLLTGLFYLPFLAISFVIAVLMFILEMTVMFTYNQSVEWKEKMIIGAGDWIKKLK
jgi:type III secretory pathway component EscR